MKDSTINTQYFKEINSYNKAYLLGFIAADGAIVQNKNTNTKTLTITIHAKDIAVLELLKSELNSSLNIKDITYKSKSLLSYKLDVNHKRFTTSRKEIIQDLEKVGLTSNKSLTMPNLVVNIPKKYRKAFILGYFDGDGSIYITKSKKYYINIRGTENLLTDYLTYFNINKKLYKYDSTFQLVLGSKEHLYTFFNKLYKDSPIYLKRKHEIFQNFLKEKCQDKTISSPLT